MMRQWNELIETLLANSEKEFTSAGHSGWKQAGAQFPAVNIYKSGEHGVTVTAEIPGMDKADLTLEVKDNQLRIAGKREIQRDKEDKIHYRERGSLEFDRQLALPFKVDPNKVDASYDKGILTLTLERSEADKPTKITLN